MNGRAPKLEPRSIRAGRADPEGFAEVLGIDFAQTGFAIVSDPAIDPALIAQAFDCAKAFFALPEAVKLRYRVPGGGGQRGYTPFGIETAKTAERPDLKEFWHAGRRSDPANLSVAEIPAFDGATYALFEALDALGQEILSAIARHLKLAPDYFRKPMAGGNSLLRLLHYPPVAPGMAGVRAAAHEDINVITLLLGAEESGLQLKDRQGQWRDVDPPPDCVVVNIGDMLQRLTNDRLPSTTHRVINPAPERAGSSRYSMPFFLHFAPDYRIEPLASCITQENPRRYDPISAKDYLRERLAEIRLI